MCATACAAAAAAGDAPLTAVHAASQVHIVTRSVLVLQHK
jgi:hypothetical protein